MAHDDPTTNDSAETTSARTSDQGRRGPWMTELRASLGLALPLIAAHLGNETLGLVDTVMIGQYSGDGMAAVAVGHQIVSLLTIAGMGVLIGLDPLLGQALGAGDMHRFRRALQRGVGLCVLLSVPLMLATLLVGPGLRALDQPEEIIPTIVDYVAILAPSMLPMLVFGLGRQTLQVLHKTRPILIVIVAANLVNLLANWLLIYGVSGPFGLELPALGVTGSALATLISRLAMGFGLVAISWPLLRPHLLPFEPSSLRPSAIGRALRIGLPIGAQYTIEVSAFHGALLVMGWISVTAVGAHQVALRLASLTFMVTYAISAAAAIRVGRAVGAGDKPRAIRAASVAMLGAVVFMLLASVVFLTVPDLLAGSFTDDAAIVALAAGTLLPLAAAFQLFDGLQVATIGVLRGLGDTRSPLLANIAGFWVLGIPTGLWLAFPMEFGPAGVWGGLVVGLGFVAIAMTCVVVFRLSRPGPLRQLEDEPEVALPRRERQTSESATGGTDESGLTVPDASRSGSAASGSASP